MHRAVETSSAHPSTKLISLVGGYAQTRSITRVRADNTKQPADAADLLLQPPQNQIETLHQMVHKLFAMIDRIEYACIVFQVNERVVATKKATDDAGNGHRNTAALLPRGQTSLILKNIMRKRTLYY